MRRLLFVIALLAALGTFVLLSATGQVARADNNSAVVIDNIGCTMIDASGATTFSDSDHRVSTTKSGNAVTKCYAVIPNNTGKVVKWSFANTGDPCITLLGTTNTWQEVIDAFGNATLSCTYKIAKT